MELFTMLFIGHHMIHTSCALQVGVTAHHVLLCVAGGLSLDSLHLGVDRRRKGKSKGGPMAGDGGDGGVEEDALFGLAVASLHSLGRLAVRSIGAFSRLVALTGVRGGLGHVVWTFLLGP